MLKQNKLKEKQDISYIKLQDELKEVAKKIEETEMLFDLAYDQDMVEAYIYQIRGLNVRYNSLIKKAKEHESGAAAERVLPVAQERCKMR